MWQEKPQLIHFGAIISAACFILWLQIRPYGVLFSLILSFWIYKTKCPSFTIIPPLTISSKLENTYQRFIQMRQDQPRICCALISAVLIALAVLGHIVSGSSIVVFGLMLAALIFSRHKIAIVKEAKIDTETHKKPSKVTDIEDDEFMPEVNESNLFVLQNAGEQAVLLSATQPDEDKIEELEIPTELLIRDTIPEIEENSDSYSDDDDDDCLATGPAVTVAKQSHTSVPSTKSSEIEFKSGYFKQNSSSSSDDDSITRGLSFRDLTSLDDQNAQLSASISHHVNDTTDSGGSLYVDRKHKNSMSTGSIVPNLMSDLVSWGAENIIKYKLTQSLTEGNGSGRKHHTSSIGPPDKQQQQQRNRISSSADSSDDSEFEILTTDELNQAS